MDVILGSVRHQVALYRLEDIEVFFKLTTDHIDQARRVLWLLYEASVTIKLRKCKFVAKMIDYLCHFMRPGRLELPENTINVVKKLKHPTTQTELCSFLGLCNMYRRFVHNFPCLAAPLNKKLKQDQPKYFGLLNEKDIAAVALVKEASTGSPVLALPGSNEQYTLDTGAGEK